MKRADADMPPDPAEALIAGGGAALREEICVLTKAQSERLFRTAYMAARSAEEAARRSWNDWLDQRARERTAEEIRQAEAEERRRADEDERRARADQCPPQSRPALPHEVLGLPQAASSAEIQKAWRRLAARWHPDRADGCSTRMADINSARDAMLRRAAA